MAKEMMKITDIIDNEPFTLIWHYGIDEIGQIKENDLLSRIVKDMLKNGYDMAFPIVLWGKILIDGHLRLKAAKAIGMQSIPVIHKQFMNKREALQYIINRQLLCRNRMNQIQLAPFESALIKLCEMESVLDFKIRVLNTIETFAYESAEGTSGPHSQKYIDATDSFSYLLRHIKNLPEDHLFFILGNKYTGTLSKLIEDFGYQDSYNPTKKFNNAEDFVSHVVKTLDEKLTKGHLH